MQIHEDMRYQELIDRMEALLIEGCTDEMRPLLEQLQTLAETEQDDIGLAASYFYRDMLADTKPGCESYLEDTKRALLIAQTKNIPYYQMKASNSMGIKYSEISDFHNSLEYYLKALNIAQMHPEFCYASVVFNNMGNLFVWLEDYEEAASYLERAYYRCIAENQNDRQLGALIIMNLIELYSNIERYDKVQEWEEKNLSLLGEDEIEEIMCFDLMNEARQLFQKGDPEAAKEKIRLFIRQTQNVCDYYYTSRCYMNVLKLGIKLADFSLCADLMEQLDRIQQESDITSFSYDYAEIKVQYWQAFQDRLEPCCHAYFEEYYHQSQARISQLRNTYARSLAVKIALEEVRDENKNVHMQNELLQRDIERDIFTNLYNKVSAERHVRAAMKKRPADKKQGFILIDIDFFKRINDNYGHSFGDKVITSVAGMIESTDREHGIAGRFGGDEFLLFLDMQDSTDAVTEAARGLQARVQSGVRLPDDRVMEVTLSIGICVIDSDMDFEEAFAQADKALYRAKELGKNRLELALRDF